MDLGNLFQQLVAPFALKYLGMMALDELIVATIFVWLGSKVLKHMGIEVKRTKAKWTVGLAAVAAGFLALFGLTVAVVFCVQTSRLKVLAQRQEANDRPRFLVEALQATPCQITDPTLGTISMVVLTARGLKQRYP